MISNRELGNRIKQYALAINVTTSEIALRLNCETTRIERLYKGRSYLSFDELEKVAKLVGVRTSQLLEDTVHSKKLYTRTILGEQDKRQNMFSNIDNLEKILDIIDEYMDIKEATEI